MQAKTNFRNSIRCTVSPAAVVALLVVMIAAPVLAQNRVPPTAAGGVLAAIRSGWRIPRRPRRTRSASAPRACSLWPQENFPQDQIIYENGPANGTTDAWAINFGYVVSDSFTGGNATGFDFYAWEFPGDVVTAVDWSITSAPNRGTVYGSGTANVVDTFVSTNQFGYDIDHISVTGLNVNANRAVWLNL